MSFFGNNSSRPATGRTEDDGSGATFLGDAASALPERAPLTASRNLLDSETKTDAPAAVATRPITPSPLSSSGPTPPDRCTNVIASGAKWQGTLNVEDSVRIEGNFSGEVRAKGTVHVSEGAQVDAKIRALFVVVAGNVRGEIRCEQRVDLLPRSKVSGQVITKVLSVHEGAILDGSVQMTADGSEVAVSSGRGSRSSSASSSSDETASERRERAAANGRAQE